MKKIILAATLAALAQNAAYATNNNNPASVGYVDNAIESASYTAGTAIRIVNNIISGNYQAGSGITISGSTITATGGGAPYTGTGAVDVSSSNVISTTFTGSNGVTVSNSGATITGSYTGTNGVDVSGSSITGAYQGGTGIDITTSGGTSTISLTASTLAVGQLYQGGIVFYLDSTGQRGLVVSLADQVNENASATMGLAKDSEANTIGSGIGTGYANTASLLAINSVNDNDGERAPWAVNNWFPDSTGLSVTACTPSTSAFSSSVTCYGGWYIPSAFEAGLLARNVSTVNTTLSSITGASPLPTDSTKYWTSTATGASGENAYVIQFDTGAFTSQDVDGDHHRVRAIRAF